MDLNKYKIVRHCVLQRITRSPWSLPQEGYEVFCYKMWVMANAPSQIFGLPKSRKAIAN